MSQGKEIRSKIKSVQNTQKITKAMQMVATSKMRKTQERMRLARPYAEGIRNIIANLAHINDYAKNISPFLRKIDNFSNVGIIFITADKGLCGGLNSNAIRLFYETLSNYETSKTNVEVSCLGQKGLVAANRISAKVISQAIALGDTPNMTKIIGPISGMLQKFQDGNLDAIFVLYSHFVNTMKQESVLEQLLPLNENVIKLDSKYPWDYIYEPDAITVLNDLIRRYIESVVYQCVADNMASEQAARMIAMRSATDNAGNAINQLKLKYNKTRQASITKELAEIVAGSVAV